jgi:hypothetical protein
MLRNKNAHLWVSFLLIYAILPLGRSSAEETPRYAQRWFLARHNLLVDSNVDQLVSLIERAGKCGYNGVVLGDFKFSILDRMPENYFRNVQRVRKAAETAKIEIIPAVFPIGYSDGLLIHDPNLAEGLPAESAPFVIKDGVAVLAPELAPRLANGGLEQARGDLFSGFSFQDDPGKTTFADRQIHHSGNVSCRMTDIAKHNPHGHCRLSQRVKVRPHACYRFSCWVKTRDLAPLDAFRLLALGTSKNNPALTFYETRLKPTQDWTKLDVVFNSLAENEVQLYAGQWGGRTGTLWVDDLVLEELALVNVLRRPGCPLVVASADGKTVYEEGKDFQPVRDPKLGNDPSPGQYSFAHAGAKLRMTAHSRIKEGDKLRVSWYHPIVVHGQQVMCCLSEPKVAELLRDQARRVNDLFHPQTFFISHDEIRTANWCAACQKTHETPGALLAANARRCVEILKQLNPQARIVVWSDMFDPHHNAVERYFLANGSLRESWKGLPADVIIANWNSGKARESLRWFAQRGHPQILAGYYDDGLENFRKWDAAAQGVPRVIGFMYTTWDDKYDLLEAYGKALHGEK